MGTLLILLKWLLNFVNVIFVKDKPNENIIEWAIKEMIFFKVSPAV